MATLLLDTHVALWMVGDHPRLGPSVRQRLLDPGNPLLVSAASVWEAGIKARLGRLHVPPALWDELERSGATFVDIDRTDAEAAAALPLHHGDPFDRMLVAQAVRRDAWLVTSDRSLDIYDVRVMRAGD